MSAMTTAPSIVFCAGNWQASAASVASVAVKTSKASGQPGLPGRRRLPTSTIRTSP